MDKEKRSFLKSLPFGTNKKHSKNLAEEIPFDREKQHGVIKCSICTGEQVAGFRNDTDGSFTEVMVIKSEADLNLFKKTYGIDKITKEY